MRVILIGPPAAREWLRRSLAGTPVEIVGEAASLAETRRRGGDADAFLLAPAGSRQGDAVQDLDPLTPRETEVLGSVAEGLSNKAIAARLGISDQTVKFHVAAICGKLGAANRTEAARIGIERGLVIV
jgi:DNA-binding CsgD family transcriptional regulator